MASAEKASVEIVADAVHKTVEMVAEATLAVAAYTVKTIVPPHHHSQLSWAAQQLLQNIKTSQEGE